MIRVDLIWGRDLDDLAYKINRFLKYCDEQHRVVLRITYNTSRSDISPSAFVEYESFGENDDTCEDE